MTQSKKFVKVGIVLSLKFLNGVKVKVEPKSLEDFADNYLFVLNVRYRVQILGGSRRNSNLRTKVNRLHPTWNQKF